MAHVLPEPARDRAGARRATTRPTRTWRPSSSSTSRYIAERDERAGGLWDEEDGFYYDVLHFADGARHAAARALDGRADPALRRRRRWARRRSTRLPDFAARAASGSSTNRPRLARRRRRSARPATAASGGCCRSCDGDRLRRVLPRMLDPRRVPLAPRRCARCRAATASTRSRSTSTAATQRRLRAGRVDDRPVRRQLELARAGLVPGQLPADRGAAALRTATSATTSPSSSRPARARRLTLRAGRRRAVARRLVEHLPATTRTAGARCSATTSCSRPTRPGTTCSRSTSTSTATPATGLGASHQTGWTGLVADLLLRGRR